MLGPFATASRRTPIHQVSLSHAACASMSTTTTTTTTTRDRGDRYSPIEWAQRFWICFSDKNVFQIHILSMQQKGHLACKNLLQLLSKGFRLDSMT